MDELMEMRQQLASMKESFDKLQIANDGLRKKVMSSKVRFLNRTVMWEIIGLPIAFMIILANCAFYDATPWVAWSFLIIGAIDVACDIRTVRIPVRDLNELPLIELRNKILRQKRMRRIQTVIGLVLVVAWMTWAYAEWFKPMNYITSIKSGDPAAWSMIIALTLLLTVAILIALWLLRKIDRANDSLLADLADPI